MNVETHEVIATIPVGNARRKIVIQPEDRDMAMLPSQTAEPRAATSPTSSPAPATPPQVTQTATATPQASTVTIDIANFAFSPAAVNVAPGQTIIWTNNDSAPHTSTSDSRVWDSKTLAQGQSFSITLDQQGAITYKCSIRPLMRGAIVVEP